LDFQSAPSEGLLDSGSSSPHSKAWPPEDTATECLLPQAICTMRQGRRDSTTVGWHVALASSGELRPSWPSRARPQARTSP